MSEITGSGLTRVFALDHLGEDGRTFQIETTDIERRRLAEWLKVEAVVALRAEGAIEAAQGAIDVIVHGDITGEVVQRCVVTLAPFTQHLDFAFDRRYSARLSDEWDVYGTEAEEIFLDLEAEPMVDPLPSAGLDLGAVIAEELALRIDDYPRSPALVTPEGEAGAVASAEAPENRDDPRSRPFSGLAERLSRRQ